jgi:hypothetical protein
MGIIPSEKEDGLGLDKIINLYRPLTLFTRQWQHTHCSLRRLLPRPFLSVRSETRDLVPGYCRCQCPEPREGKLDPTDQRISRSQSVAARADPTRGGIRSRVGSPTMLSMGGGGFRGRAQMGRK